MQRPSFVLGTVAFFVATLSVAVENPDWNGLEKMVTAGQTVDFLANTTAWTQTQGALPKDAAHKARLQRLVQAAVGRGVECDPLVIDRLKVAGADLSFEAIDPMPKLAAACTAWVTTAYPNKEGTERSKFLSDAELLVESGHEAVRLDFGTKEDEAPDAYAARARRNAVAMSGLGGTFWFLWNASRLSCRAGVKDDCTVATRCARLASMARNQARGFRGAQKFRKLPVEGQRAVLFAQWATYAPFIDERPEPFSTEWPRHR